MQTAVLQHYAERDREGLPGVGLTRNAADIDRQAAAREPDDDGTCREGAAVEPDREIVEGQIPSPLHAMVCLHSFSLRLQFTGGAVIRRKRRLRIERRRDPCSAQDEFWLVGVARTFRTLAELDIPTGPRLTPAIQGSQGLSPLRSACVGTRRLVTVSANLNASSFTAICPHCHLRRSSVCQWGARKMAKDSAISGHVRQ